MEVEVEYNYEAEQSDELSIKVGDIIKNVTISEGGWWEGELNGKKGMFPDNFVKVIKDKDAKKDEGKKKDVQASKRQSVKDLANKLKGQVHEGAPPMMRRKEPPAKKKKAKVVYSYEPENDDELKLEVGDVLDVIKQEEEGWWEGILNGKQGMFPSNFVEIVDEAGESPSPENADKFENTEEHVIKGKKIQGVGLGNIFGDGPIKLRSTAGKKPGDKPLEPPKAVENDSVYQLGGPIYNQAEKREDPVQRRLKGFRDVTEEINSEESKKSQSSLHVAKKDLSLVEKHRRLFKNIDCLDNDIEYFENEDLYVLDMSDKSSDNYKASIEEDLYEFENVDVNPDNNLGCDRHEHIEIKLAYPEEDSDVSDDGSKDIDFNNNRDAGVQDWSNYHSRNFSEKRERVGMGGNCSGDYNESLKSILDDLDNCLDESDKNEDDILTEVQVDKEQDEDIHDKSILSALIHDDVEPPELEIKASKPRQYNEKLQTLNCWKHTELTPPERVSFCRAVDSVLVTKKRLIDSSEKLPHQTPLHFYRFKEYGDMEKAARALNYAAGDLGASDFMKFSVVTDDNGSTSVVAKPFQVPKHTVPNIQHTPTPDIPHTPTPDIPHTHTVQDVKATHSKSPKTYFASLNRSGHLSPFIKSIAEKYELFQSGKPHFKKIEVEDFQKEDLEESYTMSLLSHQPDISLDDVRFTEGKDLLNDSNDLTDPLVNQMVNNYVYDVIAGGHAALGLNGSKFDEAGVVTDLNGNLKTDDDISMAVCVDENSVRIVNSKEDLDDNSMQILESSTLLCMTEGEDFCNVEKNKDQGIQWHSKLRKEYNYKDIQDKYQKENRLHIDKSFSSFQADKQFFRRRNALKTPPKPYQKFRSHGSLSRKEPESDFARHSSSYCRIPFSSNMQTFWFCKDFEESPKSENVCLTKVRSPKRTCSEISESVPSLLDIAEKNCLEEFKGKIEAFKAEFPHLSTCPLSLDNKSPAKKRRKRTTEQAIADYLYRHPDSNLNSNWNALVQLPYIEDNSNSVETFFKSNLDDALDDKSSCKNVGTTDIVASPGNLDLQHHKDQKSGSEREGSCKKYDLLIRQPVSTSNLDSKPSQNGTYCFKDKLYSFNNSLNNIVNNKKNSYCPQSTTSFTKESPVKLVRFQKMDEEFIPDYLRLTNRSKPTKCQTKNATKQARKRLDMLDFFDQYTKNTLQQPCQNKSEVKCMQDDDETVKVSRNCLILASLGFKDFEVRNAVDTHMKTTDDAVNGEADVSDMLESRNKMYSAMSKAVESCSEQMEKEKVTQFDSMNRIESRIGTDQDFSRNEEGCDVTPDVDALMNDLKDLDLSDTPQYVHNETEDTEMHAFLKEALGSLDDLMTASFTSTGSVTAADNKHLQDASIQVNDGFNNTVEIQNDSVLNVVGKRCFLHESEDVFCENIQGDDEGDDECVEIFNDPVLTIVGKKCVIHKADYFLDNSAGFPDGPSPPKLYKREKKIGNRFDNDGLKGCGDRLVDIEENVTEESFDRSLIHKATQSSPQEKNISTQTIECSILDTSVETATQTEMGDTFPEQNVSDDDSSCSIKDNTSVDYDEAYDVDGNKIDDCKAAVVVDSYYVYERQPSYFCASSSVAYYHTVGELKNDYSDEEEETQIYKDIPLFKISPIADIENKTMSKQDVCSTDLSFESPDVNFDFEVSKFLEEMDSLSDDELNRTRGSSLDTDLTVGNESNAINSDQGIKQGGQGVTDDVEDIQSRMQDSGKWLQEFMVASKANVVETEGQCHQSPLTDHLPAEFEEKVSFYPGYK
ncbi:uncharacterized protein LOC132717954 isoform X2 [Ruditapes philippinarum]|uniref:uncharacterized protein LOC132717954 isoform X2 n=1 Tax=Ruditapes philippinarum TaxID=129788 RepID=UPI00295A5FB2|nr:uncharacterized protein LOC132717954 isoform X2 [Ruditapes philippinarum]